MKRLIILALILLALSAVTAAADWPMIGYDSAMSRHSPQTDIGKDNVNQLQIKWILNTGYTVEDPPLIVGTTGYIQNNDMQVIAFDLNTGLNVWKYDPHVSTAYQALYRASSSHGVTYENGIIFMHLRNQCDHSCPLTPKTAPRSGSHPLSSLQARPS